MTGKTIWEIWCTWPWRSYLRDGSAAHLVAEPYRNWPKGARCSDALQTRGTDLL